MIPPTKRDLKFIRDLKLEVTIKVNYFTDIDCESGTIFDVRRYSEGPIFWIGSSDDIGYFVKDLVMFECPEYYKINKRKLFKLL